MREQRAQQTSLAGMGAMTHGSQRDLASADVTPASPDHVRLEPIGESRDDDVIINDWEIPREDVVLKEKLGLS